MANKKINQLVLKTTIQSTDLFPLGDPTTGQLFKKTVAELQAAIGGAVISVNGLVGTVVLDTDDIQELATPTNRYFTEARARAAISLTTTGNSGASTYSNSTGVLNVPTYTLAGLGGITASFLSGGTGITYNSGTGVISYSGTVFTDASIRALVSAGTGLSYNSSTGVFSYSGTVYTDSSIRALISLTTNGSSGASTYNNTTGVLNVPTYTLAGLGGISLTSLSGSAPITYNSSTGAIGITQASGSTNGFLSSTDWTTFNNKQSALTLGNLTEATSSVLTITGGAGAVIGSGTSIQVKQASSSVSGFLSSTDWSTFNSKQGTITLTTTGTSGAATLSGGTLNIPQYTTDVSGFVTLTTTQTISGAKTFSSILTGTSASFSSLVTANSMKIETTSAPAILYFNNTSAPATNYIALGSAANEMYFQVNSADRMVIKSNGNVGIGTTSPGEQLTLSRSSYPTVKLIDTTDSAQGYFQYHTDANEFRLVAQTSHPLIFSTNDTERMRINSDGKVRINTTSNAFGENLTVNGWITSGNLTRIGLFGEDGNNVVVGAFSTHALVFRSDNLDRGRVTAGGNFLMGTSTDNGERLYVSGSIRATGSITANSDARLKKNIERIENALEKVGQISGYTYNTIYDEDRHAGVIAQEIDKVLPEIVNKGNDGLMGVEYGNISALLIEAIKDLKQRNEKLEAIVEGLSK